MRCRGRSRWIDVSSSVDKANDSPVGTHNAVPRREALAADLLEFLDPRKRTGDRSGQLRCRIHHSVDDYNDLILVRKLFNHLLYSRQIAHDRAFLRERGNYDRKAG